MGGGGQEGLADPVAWGQSAEGHDELSPTGSGGGH